MGAGATHAAFLFCKIVPVINGVKFMLFKKLVIYQQAGRFKQDHENEYRGRDEYQQNSKCISPQRIWK